MVVTPNLAAGYRQTTGQVAAVFTSMCLDDTDNAAANGTKAEFAPCATSAGQQWALVPDAAPDGSQTLQINGECLATAGTAGGSALELATCNGSAGQTWSLEQGEGTLTNPATGLCLTDPQRAELGRLLRLPVLGDGGTGHPPGTVPDGAGADQPGLSLRVPGEHAGRGQHLHADAVAVAVAWQHDQLPELGLGDQAERGNRQHGRQPLPGRPRIVHRQGQQALPRGLRRGRRRDLGGGLSGLTAAVERWRHRLRR
jgi:hypothetical protein